MVAPRNGGDTPFGLIRLDWRPGWSVVTVMQDAFPTANTDWGFFGTIGHHANSEEAWSLALNAIATATRCSPEAVREFLDSRHGRHFADEVVNGLSRRLPLPPAIDASVTRWMGWNIGRKTSRETGIPVGLPYLTGFVVASEIAQEVD